MYTMHSASRYSAKEGQVAAPLVIQGGLKRNAEVNRFLAGKNKTVSKDKAFDEEPPFKRQRLELTNDTLFPCSMSKGGSILMDRIAGTWMGDHPFLGSASPRVSKNVREQDRQDFVLKLATKIYQDKLLQASRLFLSPPFRTREDTWRQPFPQAYCTHVPSSHDVVDIRVPVPLLKVPEKLNIGSTQPFQLTSKEDEMHPKDRPKSPAAIQRSHLSLAADEDHNWLSELQCFVRSELVEVFKASHQDVRDRRASKNVNFQQVGIRCRFCAHLPFNQRAQRSSSFPSSIPQIYQSFTMMVREHFAKCPAVPAPLKEEFLNLKKRTTQGDAHCKEYWIYSAAKLGLADSANGMFLDRKTRAEGLLLPPFMTSPDDRLALNDPPVLLVSLDDRGRVSEFIYNLMLQCQKVTLLPSELTGSRKMLRIGMSGIGCRHCCAAGQLGLSRIFPMKRNKLPAQVHGFFDHIRRCKNCPLKTKMFIAHLQREEAFPAKKLAENERMFFDRVWHKLGKTM